ncbi:MAG: hypothetical protein JW873_03605 [Candidatus Saganbacteria bacterium]|nr:hypothetical protein [Candidatus Saganbacteria bacterium]
MSSNKYKQFLRRYQRVNDLIDKETKSLSAKDKFKQLITLSQFASQLGLGLQKGPHLMNNWAILKSKI